MNPPSLKLENLKKITEEVRDIYDGKTACTKPMEGLCGFSSDKRVLTLGQDPRPLTLDVPVPRAQGITINKIGAYLYKELGEKLFSKYVHRFFFQVTKRSRHYPIVIGEDKGDIIKTFYQGIKLDPTIIQYGNIFPFIKELNGKVVFPGAEYPEIIMPGTLREDWRFYDAVHEEIRDQEAGRDPLEGILRR